MSILANPLQEYIYQKCLILKSLFNKIHRILSEYSFESKVFNLKILLSEYSFESKVFNLKILLSEYSHESLFNKIHFLLLLW
jgi:hypothetical protein